MFWIFKKKEIEVKKPDVKEVFRWQIEQFERDNKTLDMERIKRDVEYEMNCRIKTAVLNHVEFTLDRECLEKLTKEMVAAHDLKPIIEAAMVEKFKNYLTGRQVY